MQVFILLMSFKIYGGGALQVNFIIYRVLGKIPQAASSVAI